MRLPREFPQCSKNTTAPFYFLAAIRYFIKDSNFTNKEIFDKYGVNFLINGSAQRVGSQIRVTTELLELETERVLWTEKFDFLENEFFKMQDKISLEIVEALDVGPAMENSVITASNFKTSMIISYNNQ